MSDLAYSPETSGTFAEEPLTPARNRIFFGPNGLRAGWGLLLFVLLMAFAYMGIDIANQLQHFAHPTAAQMANPIFTPAAQLAEALLYIVSVVLAAVLLSSRLSFSAGKAALAALLLLASVGLLTMSAVHVARLQKQPGASKAKAAPQGDAFNPNASATPAEAQALVSEGGIFGLVLLVTWVMSRIENRNFGEYGLGGNSRRWPQFGMGLVAGFCFLSLLVGCLYLGHWISFSGTLLHTPGAIVKNGVLWAGVFLLVGFFEEFFFRGYMQYTLARGIGFGATGFFLAAFLFNFGFGFAHSSNPGESPVGVFAAGAIGFVFCISLWFTRSLWWAIGAHATWDWAESYFYGTADSGGVSPGRLFNSHPQGKLLMSGGATGPEGSALVLAIIVLIAAFIYLTLRKERDKATNQALVNPLVDPFVPAQSNPPGEVVA